MKWDNKENRLRVAFGWKIVMISTTIIMAAIFFLFLILPSSELPDEIEDADDKIIKMDEKKKAKFKIALLIAIAITGVAFTLFFRYVWKRKWG